jgi:hypothetical protein
MKPGNEEKVATYAFSTSRDVRNDEVRGQSDGQAFETRAYRSTSYSPRSEQSQPFGENTMGSKAGRNKQREEKIVQGCQVYTRAVERAKQTAHLGQNTLDTFILEPRGMLSP